jgi:hypothetical protein
MSDNFFNKNPSEYEGEYMTIIALQKDLIRELLHIINRNGIDLDNEDEVNGLLIKTEIQ